MKTAEDIAREIVHSLAGFVQDDCVLAEALTNAIAAALRACREEALEEAAIKSMDVLNVGSLHKVPTAIRALIEKEPGTPTHRLGDGGGD